MRAIPIVEPDASHTVGLVAAPREPHTPLVARCWMKAMVLARKLGVAIDRNFYR
jgi:hypothetical protein